jgi:hypothetical protein
MLSNTPFAADWRGQLLRLDGAEKGLASGSRACRYGAYAFAALGDLGGRGGASASRGRCAAVIPRPAVLGSMTEESMRATRAEVYAAIDGERAYQEGPWAQDGATRRRRIR